jgi:alpha-tubulin suppressor-like RCC1 family protein
LKSALGQWFAAEKIFKRLMMPFRRAYKLGLFIFLAGCGMANIDSDTGLKVIDSGLNSYLTSTPIPVVAAGVPTSTPSPLLENSEPDADQMVSSAVAVAAGWAHTCIITDAGRVMCWGNNEHSQLGYGGPRNSNFPIEVVGVEDVKTIVTGKAYSCALTRAGGVKCWGSNEHGELGNGDHSDSGNPVDVVGLSTGVTTIEAGDNHACAVTSDHIVYCWGSNAFGQLGDGTTTDNNIPVEVQGISGWVLNVAAGWGHTCVQDYDHNVKCWGNNEYGQVGSESNGDDFLFPVSVTGLRYSVNEISTDGMQSCVLTISKDILCWGDNRMGQLGDGTMEIRNNPVPVAEMVEWFRMVRAGWNHTCAFTGSGRMMCWGWNLHGQLGDGSNTSRTVPVYVNGLSERVIAIGVGWAHTCVVTKVGMVKCWGANTYGQLGNGSNIESRIPSTVDMRRSIFPTLTPGLYYLESPTPTASRTPTPSRTPTVTPSPTSSPSITRTKTPMCGTCC